MEPSPTLSPLRPPRLNLLGQHPFQGCRPIPPFPAPRRGDRGGNPLGGLRGPVTPSLGQHPFPERGVALSPPFPAPRRGDRGGNPKGGQERGVIPRYSPLFYPPFPGPSYGGDGGGLPHKGAKRPVKGGGYRGRGL
jgi:hypothetical protein